MISAARFCDGPRYVTAVAVEKARATSAREVREVERLVSCRPGSLILDAGCGNGRNSLPLADAGFRVVGLDRSRPLLAAAQRAAGGAKWPRFVRGSYTKLPLASHAFQAVLWLGPSVGYLGDGGGRTDAEQF